jgi:1-acyl-sn-glycerol-3-phosphate acyltransferase
VRLSPAYRAVIGIATPIVRIWGRLDVTGLDALPESGPVLLAGNHDSYWDPVVVGVAARRRRQVHALAKHSLWKHKPAGWVLDGMGQIPIMRGGQDAGALDAALAKLDEGACIGIFLEGTRTLGRELRARSGYGRLAMAHPEAEVVCCAIHDTTSMSNFPKRPRLRVDFFRPEAGGLRDGEDAGELSVRLLAEIRRRAPVPDAASR